MAIAEEVRTRTGFVSPGCYAAPLQDCDGESLTREHYISKSLLERYGDIHVQGMPWAPEIRKVSAKSLTAKVLCEKHNNALSSLDDTIGRFDDALTAVMRGEDPVANFDGEELERWALKALLGAVASGNLVSDDERGNDAPIPILVLNMLFSYVPIPAHCGLHYVSPSLGDMTGNAINLMPMTYPLGGRNAGKAFGVLIRLRAFTFAVSFTQRLGETLVVPLADGNVSRHSVTYHPNGFVFGSLDHMHGRIGLRWADALTSEKVLLLKV